MVTMFEKMEWLHCYYDKNCTSITPLTPNAPTIFPTCFAPLSHRRACAVSSLNASAKASSCGHRARTSVCSSRESDGVRLRFTRGWLAAGAGRPSKQVAQRK